MTQKDLFADPLPPHCVSTHLAPEQPVADDKKRAAAQRDTILAMLKGGCVYNSDLAAICFNYTARVSELRQAGHTITCRRIGKTALTLYTLSGCTSSNRKEML